MGDSKDRDKDRKSDSKQPAAPAAAGKRSGRVGVDERGNSVWEWELQTGVYSRDISTQKLRKLDLGDLSIAETASQERPAGLGDGPNPQQQKKLPGGGFNPYDSAGGSAGGNPYDSAGNLGGKMRPAAPGTPAPRKPMDMKRLEEWIQIRKRLEQEKQQKQDDDDD